jgi:homoserine O-acetyltransferase
MKNIVFLLLFIVFQVHSQGVFNRANIGDFKTTSGKVIKNCRLGYRIFGKLNADKTNAILFPTWFSGKSQDLASNAGTMVDTTQFCMIAVDALGNGVSSSPTNTKNFPDITIRDMVNSQYILLTKNLKINQLYAVMGISMGGMQTFEWLVVYPDFMKKAIPIVGTPKQSYFDNYLWKTEWDIIELAGKNPEYRKDAMVQVQQVHQLHLSTSAAMNQAHKADDLKQELSKLNADKNNMMNPENWIAQIKAMMGHDIYRDSGKNLAEIGSVLKAKTLVIVATQDRMVNPQAATEFARALNVPLVELTSDCAHLAPGCESAKVQEAIKKFLKE